MTPNARALMTLAFLVTGLPGLAAGTNLDTRVTLLVGFPGSRGTSESVMVVPGTVIPVAKSPQSRLNVNEESTEQTREIEALADTLRQAVGLDAVEVAYSEAYSLQEGKTRSVTGPTADSSIRGQLTLVDFNQDLAVYRVAFLQNGTVLADSKVAIERGGRAVVGGLDGETAPYFFLVVEPAGKALFVKGDVTHPRKVKTVTPSYTELARESGLQGTVILEGLISSEGIVEEIRVVKPLPLGLTEAAMEALKQWTFEPATLAGEPVPVYYSLTFSFRLSDDKDP